MNFSLTNTNCYYSETRILYNFCKITQFQMYETNIFNGHQ